MNIVIGVVLAILAVLTVVYLIRSKLLKVLSKLLHVGFVILLLVTLSALFVPQAYTTMADITLTNTGTLQSIQSIDTQVTNLINTPQNFLDSIKNLFNPKPAEEDEQEDTGLLETNLYPALVNGLGFIYRILALVLSILGLIAVIYFSYNFENVNQIVRLENRIAKLEKQLEGTTMLQNPRQP